MQQSKQASQTAQFVAILRAHHFLMAPEPKILEDSLALKLCGLETAEAVKNHVAGVIENFAKLSDFESAQIFVNRIEHSVCMRSRLVERSIKQAKNTGLKQLIILGAGLDSTAYRNIDSLENISVFEVDHPDTQVLKKARLEASGIAIPNNLKFVGFDFNNQALETALRSGGVDFTLPTLLPWLGVHMYLPDDTVRSTLAVLGQFAQDSELIMDFVMPDSAHTDEVIQNSVDQLAEVVGKMGEPFLSRYTEDALEARLREAGFSNVFFYNTSDLVDDIMNGNQNAYNMPHDAVYLLSARI